MAAVVSTAVEVASALLYLHSHGVVHGDLSAWNVLLTTSGPSANLGDRGFTAKVWGTWKHGLIPLLDECTRPVSECHNQRYPQGYCVAR